MILICGIPTEPPIAAVIDDLETREIPYALFNQREFANHDLRWEVAGGRIAGNLMLNGQSHELTAFTGIYIRLMDDRMLPELDGEATDSPLWQFSRHLHDALIAWIDLASGRVVNRFRYMGSNGSKPYQAQLIRQAGFRIPETLITNEPDQARDFVAQHQRVIYKSISGIRSVVAEMNAKEMERLDAIRACPVQFQAYVDGYDVRVHTIGSNLFATRIESTGTDYRYADHGQGETTLTPYDLPPSLAQRCLNLAQQLNLPFAGIDLRITPEGEAVCFEVNPSPAYSYYEAHTGQPISHALANYLAGS